MMVKRRESAYGVGRVRGAWWKWKVEPYSVDAVIIYRFIREHTLDKFGPVRVVEPALVCELAFEAIQRSTRHKSGIAVRFPRIARLRPDKKPQDADSLQSVLALLNLETWPSRTR